MKKAQRGGNEDQFGFSGGDFDGSGRGGRTAQQTVEYSLFGDEGMHLKIFISLTFFAYDYLITICGITGPEDIAEEEEQVEEEDDVDIGEEDEMADFIVDEEEVDEHGAPVR